MTNSAGQQAVTNAADVYMFDCFLIEVITGQQPWFWSQNTASLQALRIDSPTSDPVYEAQKRGLWNVVVHKEDTDLSIGEVWMLEQLVSLCLKSDPSARPTMDEVVDTLAYMSAPRGAVATELVLTDVVYAGLEIPVRAYGHACMCCVHYSRFFCVV